MKHTIWNLILTQEDQQSVHSIKSVVSNVIIKKGYTELLTYCCTVDPSKPVLRDNRTR